MGKGNLGKLEGWMKCPNGEVGGHFWLASDFSIQKVTTQIWNWLCFPPFSVALGGGTKWADGTPFATPLWPLLALVGSKDL